MCPVWNYGKKEVRRSRKPLLEDKMSWIVEKEVPEHGPRVSGDMCVYNACLRDELCCDLSCYRDEACKQYDNRDMA